MGSAPNDRGPANLPDFNMRFVAETFVVKRNNVFFLKNIITGDEKGIVYNNIKRKRSWGYPSAPPKAIPKTGLHPKKVLLSIWWDW